MVQKQRTNWPSILHTNFSMSMYPSTAYSPERQGPAARRRNTSGGARSFKKVSQFLRELSEETKIGVLLLNEREGAL